MKFGRSRGVKRVVEAILGPALDVTRSRGPECTRVYSLPFPGCGLRKYAREGVSGKHRAGRESYEVDR